jgi:hypothetical protein
VNLLGPGSTDAQLERPLSAVSRTAVRG